MKNEGFHDYYKIDSYCKSEGLNTEYFISSNRIRYNKKSIKNQ